MIATCQFCKGMIVGPEVADDASDERRAYAYRQLSLLVSHHMSDRHEEEAGREIMMAMALTGAAVAMRYVASGDARLDTYRVAAGEMLIEALRPAPQSALLTLG